VRATVADSRREEDWVGVVNVVAMSDLISNVLIRISQSGDASEFFLFASFYLPRVGQWVPNSKTTARGAGIILVLVSGTAQSWSSVNRWSIKLSLSFVVHRIITKSSVSEAHSYSLELSVSSYQQ
jgi:hypothetical protein